MRILVVEDDAALRSGLKTVLERAGYRAFATGDGIDADDLLKDDGYDLVVLDLGLQGMDGLKVLRRMRERGQSTPVLILSARDQTADRVRGLDLGADDYLNKPFERTEFEARVRALLRRGQHNTLLELGTLKWSRESSQAWIGEEPLMLTRHEVSVLEALLRTPGRIVTKASLAQRAATFDEPVSDNMIEVYIYRLRRKLEPAGVAIKTVRGLGYLLEAAAPR
ncbi:MAG TPA: response regulator transcription factor [Burkholderiaceae bacterium]|nr:response regulator transcription factor [Burkholderiaceae bacterium]